MWPHTVMPLKHEKYLLIMMNLLTSATCFQGVVPPTSFPPAPHDIRDTWGFGVTCCRLLGAETWHGLLTKRRLKQHQQHQYTDSRWKCHLIVTVWKSICASFVMTVEITVGCCRLWRRVVCLTFTDVSTCNITQGPKQGIVSRSICIIFSPLLVCFATLKMEAAFGMTPRLPTIGPESLENRLVRSGCSVLVGLIYI
jgi:hypothetical protein